MKNKKSILSGICILGILGGSFGTIYAEVSSSTAIKPNIVYTKTYQSASNNSDFEEMYKKESLKVINDYLGLNLKLKNDNYEFYAYLENEENLKKDEAEERGMLESMLKQKKISQDEYNKYISRLESRINSQFKKLSLANTDIVTCQLNIRKDIYYTAFDANTKEPLDVYYIPENLHVKKKSNPKIISLGIDYIKKHEIGYLKDPEFVLSYGTYESNIIYQEKNDPSKKVVLNFNSDDGKVFGFMTNNYATNMYNDIVNEK